MIMRDRELLLDRNSLPTVQLKNRNSKKPLPPLQSNSSTSLNAESTLSLKEKQADELAESIQPLGLNDSIEKSFKEDVNEEENSNADDAKQSKLSRCVNGNFDDILTFVDASVVSDWLNRANR